MFSCAAIATVPGPDYYNHPLYKIQIYILIQLNPYWRVRIICDLNVRLWKHLSLVSAKALRNTSTFPVFADSSARGCNDRD